jgi:signal transduction histidine kinase
LRGAREQERFSVVTTPLTPRRAHLITARRTSPLDESREASLRQLFQLTLWVWTPVLATSFFLRWEEYRTQPLMWPIVPLAVLGALMLREWPLRSPRVRAAAYLVCVTLALALSLVMNGPRPVNVSALAVTLLVAVLFFGPRALIAGLVLATASTVGGFYLAYNGVLQPALVSEAQTTSYRVLELFFVFGGLWFAGSIVVKTTEIYRRAAAELEEQQEALLAMQAEAESMQRRELVATLATGVAHDLANMVQVMTASAELLEGTSDHPDAADALQDMKQVGTQAGTLVRSLLSVGRGTSATPSAVDVRAFFAHLEALLPPILTRRILISFDQRASRPIMGVASRLEQAILNLAFNARDAMPGGGTLVISASDRQPTATSGLSVVLEVRDSGVGMSEETRQRIFEPFFSSKENNRGSGVGLTVVSRIVQDLGGSIEVESKIGEGTAVRLILPAA